MEGFIVGVITSILATIICAIYSRRDERIRAYLRAKRDGWRRRRYVRIFVGAVRGHAQASDTRILIYLVAVIPLMFCVLSGVVVGAGQNAQEKVTDLYALRDEGKVAPDPVQKIQQDIEKLEKTVGEAKVGAIVLAIVGGIPYFWLLVVWLPFSMFRKRFAFELERFSSRVQGLASKAELAQLVSCEIRVNDEETARVYVDCMYDVAKRHEVEALVREFLLWDRRAPLKP